MRFVGPAERLTKAALMLDLERLPHIGRPAARGHEPIEHGPVTDTEHPLDREHASDERAPRCGIPGPRESGFRHQELPGELVGFLLRGSGVLRRFGVVLVGMEQQVTEFVRGREDPPFDRDPVPGVHDHGRASVFRAHAEAEERLALLVHQVDLDPVVVEDPADVRDRGVFVEGDGAAGLSGDFLRLGVAAPADDRVEAEGPAVVEHAFEHPVGIEPLGDLGQDLLATLHPRLRPEPDAPERAHRRQQVSEGGVERPRQVEQRLGPGDDIAPLGLSDRDPGHPGLLGEGGLGQPAVHAEPGEIRAHGTSPHGVASLRFLGSESIILSRFRQHENHPAGNGSPTGPSLGPTSAGPPEGVPGFRRLGSWRPRPRPALVGRDGAAGFP